MHLFPKSFPEPKDDAPTLAVSEVFGPTIQGEGPDAGKRCMFLRLGGCNLKCSWCDTPYTWDWTGANGVMYSPGQEVAPVDLHDIFKTLVESRTRHLVITGGEPMLQQAAIAHLLEYFPRSWTVEIETNGTIEPGLAIVPLITRFNVSPKLANSLNTKRGLDPLRFTSLRRYLMTGKAVLKFVCEQVSDFDEVQAVLDSIGMPDLTGLVWIMPQARTLVEMNERGWLLTEPALARGWNVTSRLQIAYWGATRGH